MILYEHIYEIYGDIQGATNSFKIKAYEQGEGEGMKGWAGGGKGGCLRLSFHYHAVEFLQEVCALEESPTLASSWSRTLHLISKTSLALYTQ